MSNNIISEQNVTIITVADDSQIISEKNVTIINTIPDEKIITQQDNTVILETGIQGPAGPPGPSGDEEVPYDVLVDEINDEGDLYVGRADPGTATSALFWQIYKLDVTGGDLTKKYANGNGGFVFSWDLRATYSY